MALDLDVQRRRCRHLDVIAGIARRHLPNQGGAELVGKQPHDNIDGVTLNEAGVLGAGVRRTPV